jgi:hypothetical protein
VIGVVLALLVFLVVLGWDRDGDEEDGREPARQAAGRTETSPEQKQQRKRPKRRKPKPAPPKTVSLKIAPAGPVYVCLDRGEDTDRVFEGTITAPETFRGRRLRLNLGRTAVQLTLNGKRFPVPASGEPVGYDFTPRGGKALPSGQRPCA